MAEPLIVHGSTSPSPGADINTQASDSASALYEACKNEHEDVVEFLLSQGADANKANKDGLLPLHVASKKGNYRSVHSPHHAQHRSPGMPKEARVGQGTCFPWRLRGLFLCLLVCFLGRWEDAEITFRATS